MIYYIVFLLLFAYLDVNSPWSSMTKYDIKSYQSNSRFMLR